MYDSPLHTYHPRTPLPLFLHSHPSAFQSLSDLRSSRRSARLLGLVSSSAYSASAFPLPVGKDHPIVLSRGSSVHNKRIKPFPFSKLARVMGGGKNAPFNGGKNGGSNEPSLWNLPNILTLMRVFSIPVLVGIFYINTVSSNNTVEWRNCGA